MNFQGVRTWLLEALLFSLMFLSCDGDILDTEDYEFEDLMASPDLVLPLAYGDMRVEDLLDSKDSLYVKIYPDGLVYLEYDQTLSTRALLDLIEIPDGDDITGTLAVPAGVLPPVSDTYTSTEIEQVTDLDVSPEELTRLLLKEGQLSYDVSITPPTPDFRYAIRIAIPELTDTGSGDVFSETITGTGVLDLAGLLYNSAIGNRITIHFTLLILENPNTVIIAPGTEVSAQLSFHNLAYTYARGFFGEQSFDLPAERIDVDAFSSDAAEGANVSFVDPSIRFSVSNGVGVPTRLEFMTLEARKEGGTLPVEINPASPVAIDYPTTLGQLANTVVTVTNANAVLDFAPTHFYYQAKVHINYGLTSGDNFIADTSSLNINMHVEAPLHGHASNINSSDTVEIDLSDIEVSDINRAALRVRVNNEMPLAAKVQLYLADENYVILDSLLSEDQKLLVQGSAVNEAGELLTPAMSDELIPIEGDKLQHLFQSEYIILRGNVTTAPDEGGDFPDVKFKAEYSMKILLGLHVNLNVTVEL